MANPYESERLLGEYLLFHYGRAEEILPAGGGAAGMVDALDFAVRVVTETLDLASLRDGARALDLGCAVGRSGFELARGCAEVIGVDFSQNFVTAAAKLARRGHLRYERVDEGHLRTELTAVVPNEIDRARVSFEAGDACALRPDLGRFDVVLLANLIDRLPDPVLCLEQLPGLLVPGGQLVIASPFTWLEDYTPADRWLGGHEYNGGRISTAARLQDFLAPAFEFQRQVDLPFLIREHARKFQWSVSWAGVWRRR